jgi:hypothetical protein
MSRVAFWVALLAMFIAAGCSGFQANRASQAVDFNPLAMGSGQAALTPANGPGFVNGEAMDMRSHR